MNQMTTAKHFSFWQTALLRVNYSPLMLEYKGRHKKKFWQPLMAI